MYAITVLECYLSRAVDHSLAYYYSPLMQGSTSSAPIGRSQNYLHESAPLKRGAPRDAPDTCQAACGPQSFYI